MKITLGRRTLMLGTAMTIVVGGFAVAILGAGGIVAWEYSNSNAFCSNNCHAVHPEEPRAYAAYSHARVQCVECHMGRLPTLQLMNRMRIFFYVVYLVAFSYCSGCYMFSAGSSSRSCRSSSSAGRGQISCESGPGHD